jgi:hypothetical protein
VISLENQWEVLEQQAHPEGSGFAVRRLSPGGKLDLFAGVEHGTAARLFILGAGETVPRTKLPKDTHGLELSWRRLELGSEGRVAFIVKLAKPEYKPIFSALVGDILESLEEIDDYKEAFVAIIARLEQWRSLLEKPPVHELSADAQRGLYGELVFLRDILMGELGSRAVMAWKGPDGSQQDFAVSGGAVECKTSSSRLHHMMKIASERQLDDRNLRFLFVRYLSVADGEIGESLADVIEGIASAITTNSEAVAHFAKCLQNIGYTHTKDNYKTRYQIRDEKYFKVTEGFPRITEDVVPEGVGDVTYSISVAGCAPFEVLEEQVLKEFGSSDAE